VDAHYRTLADRKHRAIAGKSSGGFGAMVASMLRPELFGALATHAGDNLFEMAYIPDFIKVVRALRAFDGDIDRWWADFRSRVAGTRDEDLTVMTVLAVAAAFSASEDGTPQLPFDTRTGVLRPEVWQRWLDWDPVRMVAKHADAVRSLRAVWIDAGTHDDWALDLGAQAFRDELRKHVVADDVIHFELFDATHAAIDYRYPLSLAWLSHRIAPDGD
jgi:hypothetical protein